tara:strand:- start:11 stop:661 length:651 start_codon:yes stop_codon:yes gene_type:complete
MLMEMNKRGLLSKKGATGVSIGFLIMILFAVVFVVLAILWISGFFDTIGGATTGLPGDLEFVSQGCITSANAGLRTSFCKEYKEVELLGRDQWINCQYDDLQDAIDEAAKEEGFKVPDCGGEGENNLDFCFDLLKSENLKDGTLVNGEDCFSDIDSNEECDAQNMPGYTPYTIFENDEEDECASGEFDITNLVEEFSSDSNPDADNGVVCCLKKDE